MEHYANLRLKRLYDFLAKVENHVDRVQLAEMVEATAPAGWPVDLGDAPTLGDVTEALEAGELLT